MYFPMYFFFKLIYITKNATLIFNQYNVLYRILLFLLYFYYFYIFLLFLYKTTRGLPYPESAYSKKGQKIILYTRNPTMVYYCNFCFFGNLVLRNVFSMSKKNSIKKPPQAIFF